MKPLEQLKRMSLKSFKVDAGRRAGLEVSWKLLLFPIPFSALGTSSGTPNVQEHSKSTNLGSHSISISRWKGR